MKQKLVFLFFNLTILFFGHANGQNLVLNGDFEEVNVCAEYQEACSPVAWRSTSKKLFGYNEKSIENKYANLILYNNSRPEERKFIQTELLCPLIKGESYNISFWLRGDEFSIHSFCIGFSDRFQFYDNWLDFSKVRKGCVEVGALIQNGEWVKVEFKYKSIGNEKFIMLGNLLKDANTKYDGEGKKVQRKKNKSYISKCIIKYDIDNVLIESESGEICDDYDLRVSHVRANLHRHEPKWNVYKKSERPKPGLGFAKERPSPEKETKEVVVNKIPVPEVRKIVLRDLFFETNSYGLDLSDQKDLQDLILEMRENKNIRIHIVGHTDQKGTADYNLNLSLKRANTVKSYLSQQGVDPARMRTDGRGEAELLTTQTDEASLQLNRRVEIEIVDN